MKKNPGINALMTSDKTIEITAINNVNPHLIGLCVA